MAIIYYANQDVKGALTTGGTITVDYSAGTNPMLSLFNTSNGSGSTIRFSDQTSQSQVGNITFYHSDGSSQGGGASWHFVSEPDTVLVVGASGVNGRFVAKSAGNVAEVDYGFYDDVNTGMVRTSADNVSLVAGGVAGIGVGSTAVSLKYAGTTKLTTLNTGVQVAGDGTFSGDLTVSGGDITLGGTGRIQGIDTVTASTDAANKAYVDASVPSVGNGTLTMSTSTGLDGSASFTANQSGNSTFAVTLDLSEITLSAGLDAGATSLSLDLSEFTDMTAAMNTNDEFIVLDSSAERRKRAGEIGLSIFNNDSGFITSASLPTVNNAQITIAAGTNLNGTASFTTNQSFNETITINMDTGGVGAGSYGSTSNSTKIDNITVDAYGRVTAVTTGGTGRVDTVSTGNANTIQVSGTNGITVTANTGTVSSSSSNLATGAQIQTAINTAVTGVLKYDGTWNASTNSPTLSSGSGTVGEYYIVSVAGSTNLDGITDWAVGDWAVFSDQATDAWQKIDNTQVGNVTGSGSSGRVAFWNSDSNITSDSDLTFNGSSLVVGGTVTAQTGNSVQWNSAYNDTITGFSDSGSSTITLTLTQRDGGTLTTSFSNPQGTMSSFVINTAAGLDGAATVTNGGTVNLSLDLSELTDMTATMVGTDEFIVLDSSAERRKAANEIGLSIFNNDAGFITSSSIPSVGNGTFTVSGSNGITGSGSMTANQSGTSSAGLQVDSTVVRTSGNQSISGVKSFSGKIGADAGIDGLTNANGGIAGSNYNITGVNVLQINDPGEAIEFSGTTTVYLDVIDDSVDDKLRIRNATQLDLNSQARITNLVNPTGAQDGATKAYVDANVPSVGNGTLTVQGTGVLGGSGTFTANQSGNSTISVTHDNSGATAGSYTNANVTVNATGHITSVSNGSDAQGVTSVATGNGISGGTITSTGTLTVGAGDGLSQSSTGLLVDSTVVRTSGTQSIGGAKTFSDDVKISGTTKDLIIENDAETKAGIVFIDAQATTTQAAAIKFDCSSETLDFFMNDESAERMSINTAGALIISGGNIELGGTGRIQGVDTVSSGTDAANKTYVDNAISGVPQGTVTGTGTSGQLAIFNGSSSITSNSGLLELSTGVLYANSQFQVKGVNVADYTVSGDTDTGLGEFDGANGVSLVSKGKKEITVKEGDITFDTYIATAVATTGSLNANQSNQAPTEDTLAQLCVDPDGNVVRGEQEGTWTFTRAQLNATLGNTLIAAPGTNKAIIVTESDWMVKYSATGTVSGNQSFDVRQANIVQSSANISTLPGARINEIINATQGTPTNPSYGFCARDIPLTTRTYKTNVATTLNKKTNDQLPSGVISISVKLKYRIFNADTF